MDRVAGNIQDCLQNEPPFCAAACPFHLDVRDFIEKMQREAFNAAYRMYLNAVGFPGIVAALCNEPCRAVCPRKESDQAISLRGIEQAAIRFARNTDPNSYNLPSKHKKIAVIGAGPSGLACALRLASKKYDVTVYERSGRIGGHLWDLLSPEIFLNDFERQFKYEQYQLCLGQEIHRLENLNFDAIYIATGAGGATFGLQPDPGGAFASTTPGIFLGGSLTGKTSMEAIADGLQVALAMERFIKVGSMNQPILSVATHLKMDPKTIVPVAPVTPVDGEAFSRDEAVQEAKRCLRCSCDACIRYCDLMRFYKKYPKRIAEEVELTIHPGTLDGNGTLATRLISTCNQCGLCKEVCPIDIDMGEFLLQNHRIMREKDAMPWAFHDFWLRDMEFTNSPAAALSRTPAGHPVSRYVFFPGCQLGASDPRYVLSSYHWLLDHQPDTALMLHCCGAPAEWAGDESIHSSVLADLRDQWAALGKPVAIFACPTCKQKFERYLPEIQGIFLYELMQQWGEPFSPQSGNEELVSVFDPCASREKPHLQQVIRELVDGAGFQRQPMPLEGKTAACCSWGGQVSTANPRYAREVVSARAAQNDLPYVTYCSNCRDIFAAAHKPAYHILDILFQLNGANRVPPTFSMRRQNRVQLKAQVLQAFWKDDLDMEPENAPINLLISPEIRQKLSDAMILETEVAAVIEHCEESNRKVVSPQTGHYFGHLQIGNVTYWVEYSSRDGQFEVYNAYSHRMSIDEG